MKYSLIVLLLLVLACNNQTNKTFENNKTANTSAANVKKQMRRDLVAKALPELEKDKSTAKLLGENEDILYLESKRLSDFEILEMFKGNLQKMHNLGFKTFQINDKNSNTREIDLTVLER